MRPCACSLRTNATCSIPGSCTSSTNSARPVSSRASSFLGTRALRYGGAAGKLDGIENVMVAGASAEIRGECLANFGISRVRGVAQQGRYCHQEAGRAKAALQTMGTSESVLQRIQLPGRSCERFNRSQIVSVGLDREHDA